MHDAIDETGVCRVSTGDAFRERFGNPYAVIHRADAHRSLLEGAEASDRVRVVTGTTIQRVEQDCDSVAVFDSKANRYRGGSLSGAAKGEIRAAINRSSRCRWP